MSVFSQLMMRKKEQIMYATIKGTLTENDGVFSGFSASNYLQLQNDIDTSKDWEFVVKFDNTTSKYHSVILGSNSTANSIKIEVSYGTRFFIFLSSNGTSWNIATGAYGLTNAMSLGNTYYMKLTYSTTSGYNLYLSTDGKEWVSQYTNGATNPLYMTNSKFALGASLFDNNSLGGGIDLNRSYVKSQSTKYNLQAVVGYTVVGSPTITDGVVTDLSSSNYLKIDQSYTLTQNDNIEFYTRFKVDVLTGNKELFGIGSIWGAPILSVYNDYISGYGGSLSDAQERITTDTYYRVKLKANNGIWQVFLYDDNNNLIGTKSNNSTFTDRTGSFLVGATYGTSNPAVNSIDMNSTYIKINNKLWFNGQQA